MADFGDRCLQVAHESEQRELLANLAFMIGVGAEVMMDDTVLAMRVIPGARALAADIMAGRVRPDAVAPLVMPEHYKNESCERLNAVA